MPSNVPAKVDLRPLEARPRVQLFRGLNRLFCTTYQRLQVQTPCRLPPTGPAILVCNHMSGLDPLLLQATANRVIVWMMAKEFYELKSLGWFFRTIEAIPVARDGRDSLATRAALRALDKGQVLGIFPEGRIEPPDRTMLPFQTGVAMMAMKTNVGIYPAYVEGSQRGHEMIDAFRTPGHAYVRFGDEVKLVRPEDAPARPSLDVATDRIRVAIQSLKDEMDAALIAQAGRRRRPR